MRIGELAQAAGLDVETVRYWEKAGLLPPPARRDNNYRRYGEAALHRLRFIRNCRALDMSLYEVRSLRQLENQLVLLQQACGQAEPHAACGIVLALGASDARPVRAARGVHSR